MYSTVPDWDPLSAPRARPSSPSYYTGKPAFNDTIVRLEQAVRQVAQKVKGIDRKDAALVHLPPTRVVWRTPDQMADLLGYKLRTSEHRKIVSYLAQLAKMRPRLALAEGVNKAAPLRIGELLNEFQRPDSASVLTPTKLRALDQFGRSNALGRRKEASAKVYMIKTRHDLPGRILVNGKGLVDYFPRPVDRQQILWPLSVSQAVTTSLARDRAVPVKTANEEPQRDVTSSPNELATQDPDARSAEGQAPRPTTASFPSSFNIFAIVQGGGRSGQAGAIAHGISKALIQHAADMAAREPAGNERHLTSLKAALNKVKTLKRDPRMVERKKTNQPKARARYTWVKR